ncbi:transposase [Streptomyces sp. NPDC090088]|uniref:transposase n=1 Tax=Streptomyces sp. NPDC090088 TaxID=3365944 RepID=UPI003812C8BB
MRHRPSPGLGPAHRTAVRRATRWQDIVTGRRTRTNHLDRHRSYLQHRIDEVGGNTTIKELHEDLAAHGQPVPYTGLRDWARTRLQWPVRPDAPDPPMAAPSVRTVSGWLTPHPDTLAQDEIQQFKAVLTACPELDQAHQPVGDFAEMLTTRAGTLLPEWIDRARAAQLPGITGFASGLTADLEAVVAGLTLPWSSGSIEGAVTRIKKIKRQLYGRAGFGLLRKVILLQLPSATAPPDL